MAKANVKVTFLCPIKRVWDVVTDLSHHEWRSDMKAINIIDENEFVEVTKAGKKTKFTVTAKKEFTVWEFDLENETIKGHWTGRFYEYREKTTLDFTEVVVPKRFYLKPLIGFYLRKQQKQYFIDLKKELGCEEAGKIQVF